MQRQKRERKTVFLFLNQKRSSEIYKMTGKDMTLETFQMDFEELGKK